MACAVAEGAPLLRLALAAPLATSTSRSGPQRLAGCSRRRRRRCAFGTWFAATHTRNMELIGGWLADVLPKGLYARALIIIIAPIVVLEGVVAFVFMERHWQAVTRRLSEATARDIAAVIDIYDDYPGKDDYSKLIEMARDRLNLSMQVLPPGDLPAPRPKPFFALLDRALSRRDPPAGATAVLDRHGRPVAPRGDPRQARQRHPALRRHALADLRVELAHLPAVDGRLVGDPADRRHPVPAQPDPAHPAARRSGRRVRQGAPRARRLPPARRARGAPGGHRLPRDARPHHDARRAAHHHAGRRQPRPAHHADALQAGAGAARRYARGAVAAVGRARNAAHARGLPRLCQGRRRRGIGAHQPARTAGGGAR